MYNIQAQHRHFTAEVLEVQVLENASMQMGSTKLRDSSLSLSLSLSLSPF